MHRPPLHPSISNPCRDRFFQNQSNSPQQNKEIAAAVTWSKTFLWSRQYRTYSKSKAQSIDKRYVTFYLCTEANYLLDLKQCINAINMNQPFPGKREDFASQQAYDFWVAREKKYLNGLMTVIVMNPNLTLANKSEQDIGPTNLLTGRRSSDSRRSFVYDTSPTDDSPYTLFIYPPLPQMAACL
ncbi:hypothetical protein RMCBS344292_00656 [Rhizopus microsporus]|nr:hypothetical protein RMCBS344292_00656 [Rhizopus microsporus]